VSAPGLFEAVPNFSEGRRPEVIDAIAGAAQAAHVLDTDPDRDHNRVVLSIAGSRGDLITALMGAVREAVERIDVRVHEGVHPWVGAADVLPIVPLGSTTLEECREIALEIGHRLWSEVGVPVYFYGRGTNTTLADIRSGRAELDLGGPARHPTAGAICVGARPTLIAFNIMLPELDLAGARNLARSLRESGGGLRGVQALAFELSGGRVQLSMNLFRIDETTPTDVVSELSRQGIQVGEQQLVGLSPAALAPSVGAGRVLEGRMAAAAAVAAAARCRKTGGEELLALAVRLEREARDLGALGLDQESLLRAAERSAALSRVLNAARVLDPELDSLLMIAARGLASAIDLATRKSHPERLAALERLLS
jgi:glutamate formiminotransferase / 5-formyltetrahydrofolate cyclo-ligase